MTHLTPEEDESWDDFRERRRLVNYLTRQVEKAKHGYRPATRLIAGGLRQLQQDLYSARPTALAQGEKERRREFNRVSRRSRRNNAR